MTRRILPSVWSAASDRDYDTAVGRRDTAGPVASAPASVTIPGPCVPCARVGRVEVSGRCPIHDAATAKGAR